MFSFEQSGSEVLIYVDTGLDIDRPIKVFSTECHNEMFAALLKERLDNQLREFERRVAMDAFIYLDPDEISKLKKILKSWDSNKKQWKY